jgi:hypothetical protein
MISIAPSKYCVVVTQWSLSCEKYGPPKSPIEYLNLGL